MDFVLKMLNAHLIPNSTTQLRRNNVFQLIAQMLQIPKTGLVLMVNAMLLVLAQTTLKRRSPVHQRDVPQIHALPDKSLKKLVHALTVPIMKRPHLMERLVKLTVAPKVNSIPQMLYAMTTHAQSTSRVMLTPPLNALQRHMHVMVNQITLRKLSGLMMLEHVSKSAQTMI